MIKSDVSTIRAVIERPERSVPRAFLHLFEGLSNRFRKALRRLWSNFPDVVPPSIYLQILDFLRFILHPFVDFSAIHGVPRYALQRKVYELRICWALDSISFIIPISSLTQMPSMSTSGEASVEGAIGSHLPLPWDVLRVVTRICVRCLPVGSVLEIIPLTILGAFIGDQVLIIRWWRHILKL